MNVKTIRNSVKMKKGGVLLALALSVSVMFGNSMTAEAAEIRLLDENSLQVGQELQGGDVISKTSYTSTYRILIDGRKELEEWNTSDSAYTLPAGVKYSVESYSFILSRELSIYVSLTSMPLSTTGDNGGNNSSNGNNNGNNDNIPVQSEEDENQNQAASYYQSDAHVHTFSWVTVQEAGIGQDGLEEYRCSCGLVESRNTIPGSQAAVSQFKDMIESAPAGEKISFDTGRLYTLSDSIIKKLAERNDVSAEITFEYQGKNYKMTIPAGADYTAILGDEENFYGYFYFAQLIGATIEEI